MPVFKYKGVAGHDEEFVEEGIVIARDEFEAREKLKPLDYRKVNLKKLAGFSAFVKQFSADIR